MFHFSLRQGFPSVQFSHSVMSDSATHGLQHDQLARWCSGKESACRCRRCKRHEFNPWVGKTPWRMAWGPTQYSCLENPMDRGAWMPAIHGVAKSQTWLSDWAHTHTHTHTHTFTHTFYAASGHLDPTIPGLSKDTGPISDLIASHSCQPASSQRPCHHTPSKRTTHLSPRQEAITEHIKKASARQAESSLLFPVIFVLNHLVLRSGLPAGQCAIFLLPFRSTLFLWPSALHPRWQICMVYINMWPYPLISNWFGQWRAASGYQRAEKEVWAFLPLASSPQSVLGLVQPQDWSILRSVGLICATLSFRVWNPFVLGLG